MSKPLAINMQLLSDLNRSHYNFFLLKPQNDELGTTVTKLFTEL